MRRFEGHQRSWTKQDVAVFTESAAVKVSYILLRISTPSRHNRAIQKNNRWTTQVEGAEFMWLPDLEEFPQVTLVDEFGVCCRQRDRIFSDP